MATEKRSLLACGSGTMARMVVSPELTPGTWDTVSQLYQINTEATSNAAKGRPSRVFKIAYNSLSAIFRGFSYT
ncbi:hypothetical protein D3C77_740300 [compost metagenome]